MSQDINPILNDWEFDPKQNVRKIWGDDGTQKLQVRIEQGGFAGILQMDLEGRPDGKQPYGFDFVLDYYQDALRNYRKKHGTADGFALDQKACAELFDESFRIYNRYVFLLQIGDYGLVIRDTERNMRVFRFVHAFAKRDEDRAYLERWWPYILRIRAISYAMIALKDSKHAEALEVLDKARQQIRDLPEVEAEEFRIERDRSERSLAELQEQIKKRKPLSREERLERRLDRLVKMEAYERAAEIRDELKRLRDD